MKIAVFSDTHRAINPCIELLNKNKFDMIIHAGDHDSDADDLNSLFPEIPMVAVSGNCDYGRQPYHRSTEIDGVKILVTHGHMQNVKNDMYGSNLRSFMLENNADIVIYGHTHRPCCERDGSGWIINPGSVKYSRTYAVIEISDGKIKAGIVDF